MILSELYPIRGLFIKNLFIVTVLEFRIENLPRLWDPYYISLIGRDASDLFWYVLLSIVEQKFVVFW